MQYIDLQGDYAVAYNDALTNGGQFYPGNGNDSANVIVRGKQCFTYWKKGSKRKQEIELLCKHFAVNSYGMTGGRLARWLLNDLFQLPYSSTFWQKKYRELAQNGGHWHYMHIQPKTPFCGIEVDLKSAYVSSLFAGQSLLYQDGKGYIDDNNCLENLKQVCPSLPKWFRLQLLGILASWRFFFYVRPKNHANGTDLILKKYHKISYGGAFNATHRAILRNYKIMQKVHQIGGEHIKRMHTDSFFLSVDASQETEQRIWDYLESKQCRVDIKSAGFAYFFDLNTGFVGNKFVGSRLDVVEKMREYDIKMKRQSLVPQVLDRFGDRLAASSFQETDNSNEISANVPKEIQLTLNII